MRDVLRVLSLCLLVAGVTSGCVTYDGPPVVRVYSPPPIIIFRQGNHYNTPYFGHHERWRGWSYQRQWEGQWGRGNRGWGHRNRQRHW